MFLTKLFFKKGLPNKFDKKKGVVKRYNKKDLKSLSKYIGKVFKKGFSEKKIEKMLLSTGWPKEIIEKEIPKIKIKHDKKLKKIKRIKQKKIKKGKIRIERNKKPKRIKRIKQKRIKKGKITNKKKKEGDKMPKKMTKEDAGYLLREVEPERCFWVNNGPIINGLEALQAAINEIGEEAFSYHVNNEKNDFSVWVNEVIGDKALARNISKAKTKETFLKRVKGRLASLKKVACR